jgi:hypothetical protein
MKRIAILLSALVTVVAILPVARAAAEATADLKVSVTGPTSITAGGSATYQMTIRNDGPDSVPSASMKATWTRNLTIRTDGLTGVSGFCGWSSTPDVICGVAGMPMAAGDTRTVTITGVVNQTITGQVRLTASVLSSGITDPVPGDNSGQVASAVVPACPPAAAK